MTAKQLKYLLDSIPDDMEICIVHKHGEYSVAKTIGIANAHKTINENTYSIYDIKNFDLTVKPYSKTICYITTEEN